MCSREIINIKHKTIKHIIVYEIFVTVKVIKSKLIIVILKEPKGFRVRVLVQNFLNALKSLGGIAAMLIISRLFSTIKLRLHQYVRTCCLHRPKCTKLTFKI